MAKMLKQLVFGQKKNPPAPPRPDYEGEKLQDAQSESQSCEQFFDHDYENLPKFNYKASGEAQFAEKKELEIVVFDNYSEPADLRAELSALESDPLYMSPLDDQGCAPPLPTEEEDMYCVPYDTPEEETPPLPQPCFVKGYLSHKLGRKAVLLYVSSFYVLGWLVIAYAPTLSFVYGGRLLTGFSAGICSVAVPAYIVEISTVGIRGFLSAGFQVAFSLGVFLVMALGVVVRWSWLAIAGSAMLVVGACLMYFMPESPSWLARNGRNIEALKALGFIRGKQHDSLSELKEILEHISEEPKSGISWHEFLTPGLYRPSLIALSLMFFQQFSGINALMSYAVELFQETKISLDPFLAAMAVALVQLVATSLSSVLMDRVGRKALYMTSGLCIGLSLMTFGTYSYYSKDYDAAELKHWSLVPLLSFVLYIASFSLGFGPIPFVVIPEMVPTRLRSLLLAIASVSSSFFGFVVTKVFAYMRSFMGLSGVYWTYSAFSVLGFVFYWIFVPETKGRTVHEIHRQLSSH